MIRRPPRSTQSRSSAASDVYKRQVMEVMVEKSGKVCTVIINRPEVKNAVDGPTGEQLFEAFKDFDRDDSMRAAVLCGNGGTFCAGADLKTVASGDLSQVNRLYEDMSKVAPMGPTRLLPVS